LFLEIDIVKYYNSEVSGIILHCGYKDHSTKWIYKAKTCHRWNR